MGIPWLDYFSLQNSVFNWLCSKCGHANKFDRDLLTHSHMVKQCRTTYNLTIINLKSF